MAGGLIQISTYGSQDLFLVGTPEITFFKIVYRRHTNFSSESIEITFADAVDFGEESTVIIPNIGDLIGKMYLKLTIPQIILKRKIDSALTLSRSTKLTEYNKALSDYYIVEDYMNVMLESYRKATDVYNAINVTTAHDIYTEINNYFLVNGNFDDDNDPININTYIAIIPVKNLSPIFDETKTNMLTLATPFENSVVSKNDIYTILTTGITECIKVHKYFYDILNIYFEIL